MLTWMIYAVSVSVVASVVALAAEHSARQRRTPGRWFWLLSIVASLAIPSVTTLVSIEIPAELRPSVPQNVIALHEITSMHLSPAVWVENHGGGSSTFQHVQLHAKDAWYGASLLMILALLASATHLQWRKRQWATASVCDVSVFISTNVGPAVVGLLRSGIVLPVWLLDSPLEQQAAVMAHENSHIDAHDPTVFTIALCLIALMPWNLPLWWQLQRLRCAIEVDCDARVLEAGQKFAVYGETLIAVGERQSRYIGSVAGMSESRSFLERRLKIMTHKAVKPRLITAAFLVCSSTALVVFAAQVSPPSMTQPSDNHQFIHLAPDIVDRYVGTYKANGFSVLRVTRDGDRILTTFTGERTIENFAESETQIYAPSVKGTINFDIDQQGHVTRAVLHQFGNTLEMQPIAPASAQQIEAFVADKIKTQTATPGSEAALRSLIGGLVAGNPNYAEMSPALADATREQLPRLRESLNRLGTLQTLTFIGVGGKGWDVYQARFEHGFAIS